MTTLLLSLLMSRVVSDIRQAMPDTLYRLDELRITAAAPQAASTSGATWQHLSYAQLQRMGVTDVAEAAKHFAGVQVRDYGGMGGLKTVSVRGLGALHTGVNYDGVMVGNAQSGQVDIARFALDNVSDLWLSIGQQDNIFVSAKEYGSAATLHIGTLTEGMPPQRMVNVRTGSFGLAQLSALWGDKIGGKTAASGFVDVLRADGLYPYTLYNGTHRIESKRYNADTHMARTEANVIWYAGRRQKIHGKVYGFLSERGLPGGVIYDNQQSNERLTDKNIMVQGTYENNISKHLRMRAATKWSYLWNKDFNLTAQGEACDKFRQNEYYATATLLWQIMPGMQVSMAQDYMYNHLSTTFVSQPKPDRHSWYSAAAATWQHSGWKVTTSLMNTHIVEKVSRNYEGNAYHRLSPAFSLAKDMGKGWQLRLAYKDIFRTPTLTDLYYRLVGNTHLRPEKTKQWNMGLTWQLRGSGVLDYIAFTTDGYYGTVRDKIVAVPTMFVWKMQNVGKATMLGLDITSTARLHWSDRWWMHTQFTWSYISACDKTDRATLFYNHQLAYTPQHTGSLLLTWHTPLVDVSYNMLAVGTRYSSGYNDKSTRMDGFGEHSITIARNWKTWKLQIDLRNIGNTHYEVVRFYPMPGFNWRTTLTYQL